MEDNMHNESINRQTMTYAEYCARHGVTEPDPKIKPDTLGCMVTVEYWEIPVEDQK